MRNDNYLSPELSLASSIINDSEVEEKNGIINFLFNEYCLQVNQYKTAEILDKMGLENKYVFIDMTKIYFFNHYDGYYVKRFLNFDAYTSFHAEQIKKQELLV